MNSSIDTRLAVGIVTVEDLGAGLEGKLTDVQMDRMITCQVEIAGELKPVGDVTADDLQRHFDYSTAEVAAAQAELELFEESVAAVSAVMLPGEKLDPAALRARGVSDEHIRALEHLVATQGEDLA